MIYDSVNTGVYITPSDDGTSVIGASGSSGFLPREYPHSCSECQGDCFLCEIEDGKQPGFMDKCSTCDKKFLCATSRFDEVIEHRPLYSDVVLADSYAVGGERSGKQNRTREKAKRIGRVFLKSCGLGARKK